MGERRKTIFLITRPCTESAGHGEPSVSYSALYRHGYLCDQEFAPAFVTKASAEEYRSEVDPDRCFTIITEIEIRF